MQDSGPFAITTYVTIISPTYAYFNKELWFYLKDKSF